LVDKNVCTTTSLTTKRISTISQWQTFIISQDPQDGGESQLASKLRHYHLMCCIGTLSFPSAMRASQKLRVTWAPLLQLSVENAARSPRQSVGLVGQALRPSATLRLVAECSRLQLPPPPRSRRPPLPGSRQRALGISSIRCAGPSRRAELYSREAERLCP